MDQEKVSGYLHQLEINSRHLNEEIGHFSQAVVESPFTEEIVGLVGESRPDLTPLHFGLLLYSSYKYAFYWGDFNLKSDWGSVVRMVNSNPETLLRCLGEKSVNITSPYRYSALNLAISNLSGLKEVSVADIGCGFYPFGIGYEVGDYLPEMEGVQDCAYKRTRYSRIEAVDLQNPDPVWAAANQWEPLSKMPATIAKYEGLLLASSKRVNFQVGDIVASAPKIIPVDYCFTANILYQIPAGLREVALKNIAQIVKPDGVLLTADFLPNGSRKRPFTYAIKSYRLNSGELSLTDGKMVFLLENADCQKVRYL